MGAMTAENIWKGHSQRDVGVIVRRSHATQHANTAFGHSLFHFLSHASKHPRSTLSLGGMLSWVTEPLELGMASFPCLERRHIAPKQSSVIDPRFPFGCVDSRTSVSFFCFFMRQKRTFFYARTIHAPPFFPRCKDA